MALALTGNLPDNGEGLDADILRAEFQNILTNALTAVSPMTGDLDAGGNNILGAGSLVLSNIVIDPVAVGQMVRAGSLLKFHDGSRVRVNQVVDSAAQSGGAIANTAAEESLYNYTLLANSLGTLGRWEADIDLRIGLLNGASVDVKAYFDGGLITAITIANSSGSTAGLTLCPLKVTLSGNGSTSAQFLKLKCEMTRVQNNLADAFGSLTTNVAAIGAATVNTTANKTIQINVLFSGADAANQCDYLSVLTKLTV